MFSGPDNGSWPILFIRLGMFLHFIKVFFFCFLLLYIILAVRFLSALHHPAPSSLQLFVEPTNKSSLRPFCLPGNNAHFTRAAECTTSSDHILPPLSWDYSENGKFCKTEREYCQTLRAGKLNSSDDKTRGAGCAVNWGNLPASPYR